MIGLAIVTVSDSEPLGWLVCTGGFSLCRAPSKGNSMRPSAAMGTTISPRAALMAMRICDGDTVGDLLWMRCTARSRSKCAIRCAGSSTLYSAA